MPAATGPINTTAEYTETVTGGALVRETCQYLMHTAERVLLMPVRRPFADCAMSFGVRLSTLHVEFRSPSFGVRLSTLWSPTIHAACGDARLAARGERGEERGRDTRVIGWAPRGQCFFMLVHSYLGTPLGSGSDLGRFGHV